MKLKRLLPVEIPLPEGGDIEGALLVCLATLPGLQNFCKDTDRDGSDLDLLVDAVPGATLLDLGDLEEELKSLLGVDVHLLTPGDLPPKFWVNVLAEALPV